MKVAAEYRQKIPIEFRRRRARQLAAIGTAVFLLVSLLWKTGHPGFMLGELSRPAATALEAALIAVFVVFSALNWRCPACNRYLGGDISPKRCRRCKASLQ